MENIQSMSECWEITRDNEHEHYAIKNIDSSEKLFFNPDTIGELEYRWPEEGDESGDAYIIARNMHDEPVILDECYMVGKESQLPEISIDGTLYRPIGFQAWSNVAGWVLYECEYMKDYFLAIG